MATKAQKPTDMIKMLIFPAVYMFSGKIDFKDPQVIQYCQIGFTSVVVLILSIYYFIYTRINAKNEVKVIWVPPKPQPSLPFGLGPEPEKVKPSDFTKTHYKQHENKLLQESVQQLLMQAGISFFIGYQFKIYLSLIVQALTLPFTLYDSAIFRKHVLGHTKNDDGSNLYNEQFSAPTVESIAVAEKLAAARAAGVGATPAPEEKSTATPSVAKSAIPADEPRVVEITEEEEKPATKETTKVEAENKKTEASPHDID
eukprot:gene6576-7078_t